MSKDYCTEVMGFCVDVFCLSNKEGKKMYKATVWLDVLRWMQLGRALICSLRCLLAPLVCQHSQPRIESACNRAA